MTMPGKEGQKNYNGIAPSGQKKADEGSAIPSPTLWPWHHFQLKQGAAIFIDFHSRRVLA